MFSPPLPCESVFSAPAEPTLWYKWLSSTDSKFEEPAFPEMEIVARPSDGGIREDIPDKYKDRYTKWRSELLSTEFGREQWAGYAGNHSFILTIKVSEQRGKGAGTDKFSWDNDGNFVGATITLGSELDQGYPPPVYYPVLNALSPNSLFSIDTKILAATKLSHEISHVSQTANENMKALQLQSRLTPLYISIFLKNGLNTKDKQLVDLASQMGGTPTELWESREYWSEVDAMLFLQERIRSEAYYCHVFNKIKHNLDEYAKGYENRFDQNPRFAGSPCWK
jgi:hypothetical protein